MNDHIDDTAIAIVGVALALPEADSLDTLHANLSAGRDSVRSPAADRVRYVGGVEGVEYAELGYLDRVDLFDHRFFGISLREAELMDPHQRMSLHLVHQAIENACYAPKALRGSNTAVIVSSPSSDYPSHRTDDDPQRILGSLPSATAARIAYLFDLLGPTMVVDTACSGSLTALALAVEKLRHGKADLAITGGLSIETSLLSQKEFEPLRGVVSSSGRCRPFDASADGTVGGEGGGFVVLKRLPEALADGDHIHGVLRGIAVNHNGFRATSMSAPDQTAQAEVITAAWRDAGVDGSSIGYVECHGSGTPLGDVVEIAGLRKALDASTGSCVIGAVKGNLGHLDHASGMAGLFKVLAGLRHSTRYPVAHFQAANPMIDLSGPVRVSAEVTAWADEPRRAGLSSFGLTGTNVHAVIEQAPASPEIEVPSGDHLVTVSAKSASALEQYSQQLQDFLVIGYRLAEVAQALNRGRDDYPYRLAFTAHTTEELAESLRSATLPERPVTPAPVVLLFSGDGDVESFPEFDGADLAPAARLLVRQHALCLRLRSLGLTENRMVGSAGGNLAVRVLRGQLSMTEALSAATEISDQVNSEGLLRAARGFADEGAVLVEVGVGGVLSRKLAEIAPELRVISLGDGVLAALGKLYELGVEIDWERHYEGTRVPRIEAPTTVFEPVSCWTEQAPSVIQPAPVAEPGLDGLGAEEWVVQRWARLLKADDVRADSNYFELGGTSIAGISVLREIESHFGVLLAFADLYEYPTARELAGLIEQRGSAKDSREWTITPLPRGGKLPLSFNQEQLWYLDRLNPGQAIYNIPTDLRYSGLLDVVALSGAVQDLASRHEVLRTRIPDADGQPYVLADLPLPVLDVVDVSTAADPELQARKLADAEAGVPFDLARGPMVRTTLFKIAPDDHLLQVTWHHIIFDGWTPAVFLRDLSAFYQSRVDGRAPSLPELPVQYADFAGWQRSTLTGDRLERGLAYWRETMADLRAKELPLDRPRPPVQSHAGDLLEFTLDPADAAKLREFSRAGGVTTFVTMLAAIDALMHLWAGQEDVVIGSATTGRTNSATHELIGYFNNMLPFRTEVTGDLSFRELVRRCSVTVAGALDNEEIPFSKIISELRVGRDASRHPLFTVGYTHQNTATHSGDLAGLTVTPSVDGGLGIAPGTSKFDLTIGVADQDDGPMRGYLEYAVDLFDAATMRRVIELFESLISAAMRDPDQRLADLLPSTRAVLAGDSGEVRDERLLWEIVRDHAADRPDHPAIVDGREYSYRELDLMAGGLADRLVAAGVRPETPVPVLAQRGAELVVGWLGALKAGAAFVPINPSAPAARIAEMLAELDAPVLVVGGGVHQPEARVVLPILDAAANTTFEPPRSAMNELAYIAYTSGSTGRPHGCQIEHRSLMNLLHWYGKEVGLSTADRTSQMFSAGFDGAVLEILSSLCHGATVHFMREVLQEPAMLMKWLADSAITVAFLPTPLLEIVLGESADVPVPSLRAMCTGGDRLRIRPPEGLPYRVVNCYGPTECAVAATAGDVAASPVNTLPSIGGPIAGARAYVLNDRAQPVAVGELGELYLGGVVVGRGYLNLPGVTATRFVADPFGAPGDRMYRTGDLAVLSPQGTIEFRGRTDNQLEIRGHRVEPAEVERVLTTHPDVRECVVMAEGSALVAHIAADAAPVERDLIAWVARGLPAYMVPARVITHSALPRTANGKLDRKGVGETVVTAQVKASYSGSEVEGLLTRIWSDLLDREGIGPDDDFFAIGGDSVLSVAIAGRAARQGVNITPQDVLTHPTVRGLASVASVTTDLETETEPVGPIELTPLMHSFIERMTDRRHRFPVIEVLETAAEVSADAMRAALEKLVEVHEALRYRFRRNNISWRVECAEREDCGFFDVTILPPMSEEDERALLDEDKAQMVEEIDLERGPLLRARFYDRGHGRTGVLNLVVHHFAYDAMSLVPVLEDLNALLSGSDFDDQPRPAAWRSWSAHLQRMAASDELARELAYWTGIVRAGSALAPIGEPRPGESGHAVRIVSGDQVAEVLSASGSAAQEAAMAAVACALARWRGSPDVYLFAEGEATPNVFRPGHRSRSIGWFTSAHPVLLPVDANASTTEALPAIATTLRSVPNDGVGYGMLRHLSPNSPGVRALRSFAEPQVFAEHTAHGGESMNAAARSVWMRTTPLSFVRTSVTQWAPLVVSSSVVDGELVLALVHDGRFAAGDIEKLADHLVQAFVELTGIGER